MTDVLYIDLETRSTVDLRKAGLYVYVDHPTTDVTLARLAIGRETPIEWRPGWDLPGKYFDALADPATPVVAHSAAFERLHIERILGPRHGWPVPTLDRYVCTMARARAQALPGALDAAANAAGLDVRKDLSGHALMLRMCRPRTITSDGEPIWWTDEERMGRLSEYCSMDVKVERALYFVTAPLPACELDVWRQTEVMNDRGIRFDLDFVRAARMVAEETRTLLDEQMFRLTSRQVSRASNVTSLKKWLLQAGVDLSPPPELTIIVGPVSAVLDAAMVLEASAETEAPDEDEDENEKLPDLRRRDVLRLLADDRVSTPIKDVLRVRLEAGKTSARKLDAILHRADATGVVRGLLGFHGANTGRFISHGVQIQNLPRDGVADWEGTRDLIHEGAELVDCLAGPPLEVISRMLRGAIIPRDGHEIASADYTSVEAVGVAWLAGEETLLNAFRRGDKVYEKMAATVYGVAVDDVTPPQRHVGKTLILGAGYQMGWWKFRETVLLQSGMMLEPEEAQSAIDTYRETLWKIPLLWRDLRCGAIDAVRAPGNTMSAAGGRVRFRMDRHWLRMRLPSGRSIWYRQPLLEPDKYGSEKLTYMGVNPKNKKWERQSTYGGRLTENAVQGLCRDLLVDATLRLEAAGYRPTTLVHDEIIAEPPIGHGSIAEMCELMCELPDWAGGFPLMAKGRRGCRYGK